MMPPVPNRIQDRILHGEFIDFTTLLPQATFTGGHMKPTKTSTGANKPLLRSPGEATWMEAWNVYISVVLS